MRCGNLLPKSRSLKMKQSILVLGARGFIGAEVVSALASTDWATPILGVRRPASGGALELRTVDANDAASILAALEGVAAVVNCVAGAAGTLVQSATALHEAARRAAPAPRIVHLSSMSVYGSATGLIDETATLRGDLGAYSVAKISAENAFAAYPHMVIFRPGCVFSARSAQWGVRMARLLQSRRLGDLGANGDGYCNLVHVADVAQAIALSLQMPQTDGGVFNLSTPDPPTWNEFLTRFAIALRAVPVQRISDRRQKIESKLLAPPLKIMEILARKGKISPERLPPPIPPSLFRVMSQEIRLDTRCAESRLGMRWRSLDASLAEAASELAR
jgi:nucleoside-diphosphate-sugar epimerase